MAVPWFRPSNKEDDPDNNQGEFKPDVFKTELATEFETKFKKFQEESDAKLTPLLAMAESFKAATDRQKQIDDNKRQSARNEELEVDDDLWITNPAEAARRTNAPANQQIQALAAITMRKEVLSDKEYYTGDIKDKIDQLIEQQPLHLRANKSVLENAYYTVLGRHTQEITDGKLKKQAAFSGFNGNGTGANGGGDKTDVPRKFNEEEQLVMKKFGMDDKEFLKMEQEMGYV